MLKTLRSRWSVMLTMTDLPPSTLHRKLVSNSRNCNQKLQCSLLFPVFQPLRKIVGAPFRMTLGRLFYIDGGVYPSSILTPIMKGSSSSSVFKGHDASRGYNRAPIKTRMVVVTKMTV